MRQSFHPSFGIDAYTARWLAGTSQCAPGMIVFIASADGNGLTIRACPLYRAGRDSEANGRNARH